MKTKHNTPRRSLVLDRAQITDLKKPAPRKVTAQGLTSVREAVTTAFKTAGQKKVAKHGGATVQRRADMPRIDDTHLGPAKTAKVSRAVIQLSFHPNHPIYAEVEERMEALGVSIDRNREDFHHGKMPVTVQAIGVKRISPATLPLQLMEDAGFGHFKEVGCFVKATGALVVECILGRTKKGVRVDVSPEILDYLNTTLLPGFYYLCAVWQNPAFKAKRLPASVNFCFGSGEWGADEAKFELVCKPVGEFWAEAL